MFAQRLCLAIVLSAVSLLPATALAKRLYEKAPELQGTWEKTAGTMAWNPAWGDQREGVTFGFEKDEVVLATEKSRQMSRLVVVDDTANPKRLCFVTQSEGPAPKRSFTTKCIYEVRGDTLKLCWSPAVVRSDYPAGFDDPRAQGSIVLKRVDAETSKSAE